MTQGSSINCAKFLNNKSSNHALTSQDIESSKMDNQIIVNCWGRKYIFNGTIFPTQIISQDEKILSSPIRLNIFFKNKILKWENNSIKEVSNRNGLIILEGNSISDNGFGQIQLQSKIIMEPDGLMQISLTINSQKSWNPGSVVIDIPYKTNAAKYYFKWVQNSHSKYSGIISDHLGIQIENKYTPYFWVGDNKKGLYWFCENTYRWPNSKNNSAIQIIKTQSQIIQRLNIGNTKIFNFGLMATPVKAFPKDWRKWRISPAVNSNIFILWPKIGDSNSTKYYGLPEAVDEIKYKTLIRGHHEKGEKVIAYANITRIPSLSPLYQKNKSKWVENKVRMDVGDDELVFIEPDSPGYIDSIVKLLSKYMIRYNLDGYYFDGTNLFYNWKDKNGNKYFPILGYRELQQKVYISLKKINPNALIICHMSADMNIPVLTYCDAYLDGEQFRANKKGELFYYASRSLLDSISLDQFRIEFMGKQWGIVPFFLPEIAPSKQKTIQPTEGLAALLLQHDVQPWATNSNLSVWNKMFKVIDSFGISDASFFPYYSIHSPANANVKGVLISAYKKPNGKILLIVSNLSNLTVKTLVTINLSSLNISKLEKVSSFNNNENVDFSNGNFSVLLSPLSYSFYILN